MCEEINKRVPFPAKLRERSLTLKQQPSLQRSMTRNRWSIVVVATAFLIGITTLGFPLVVTAEPINSSGVQCPGVSTLTPTSPSDEKILRSLLPTIIRQQYPDPLYYEKYEVTSLQQAAEAGVYGKMATRFCGEEVAKHTWVVQLFFSKLLPSDSLSQGQLFIAKTKRDWHPWFRYH